MKPQLACIPCIMKQAYNTAIRATDDQAVIRKILDRTAEYVRKIELEKTPADLSNFAYRITSEITGIPDPYKEDKKRFNDVCLDKTPELRKTIDEADDPVRLAVRLAILGNVIDLGIGFTFDIEKELKRVHTLEMAIDDYSLLRKSLQSGKKKILYLCDNAGEIVFDMLLVERLLHDNDITCVVKSGPIINDATMHDADYIGLTDRVNVIETGSDGIGVKWDEVSDEFVRHYEEADIIVSKGQGNFETMSDKDKEIYFLLKAKCDSVAEILGVKFGDIVFKKGPVM